MSEGHDHADESPAAWTCSMHPQIQLPTAGKCPICFMDLIPVSSDDDESLDPSQLRMTPAAAKLAQIQTAPVRRAAAAAEVRLYGRLAYDERRLSYITAWAPGRLDKLYVDFTGAAISKGDALVSLYSPELLATREELIQAAKAVSAGGGRALTSTAQATLEAAREKLRLYGLTDSQVEALERGDDTEDHLTIYSPASGIVVDKNAVEGMYVAPGTRLFTIADLSKLWVIFDAYETDLPWLAVGQTLSFSTRSLPGESFEAVITFIDPTLNAKTRTIRVRAEVDNDRGRLKPDMFAQGVVTAQLDAEGGVSEVGSDAGANEQLLIPATAPLVTGKRAVVYVELPRNDDHLFEGRVVELGPRAGEFYIVKDGLREGEMVVVNGAFKIDAELQIRAKPSMMTPQGGNAPPEDGSVEDEAVAATDQREDPIIVSHAAVMTLAEIYEYYFRLQTGLAEDNLEKATTSADDLVAAVAGFDHSVFPAGAHWPLTDLTTEIARDGMAAASGVDIESVRASFELVSTAVIKLHDKFGHADDGIYYLTYCPMAFDNKGAYWLQTDSIINNPYFGEMMLRCGEIKARMDPVAVGN
jgi:Cu(I)/Ag(I) efflux system membrane fusion protein